MKNLFERRTGLFFTLFRMTFIQVWGMDFSLLYVLRPHGIDPKDFCWFPVSLTFWGIVSVSVNVCSLRCDGWYGWIAFYELLCPFSQIDPDDVHDSCFSTVYGNPKLWMLFSLVVYFGYIIFNSLELVTKRIIWNY